MKRVQKQYTLKLLFSGGGFFTRLAFPFLSLVIKQKKTQYNFFSTYDTTTTLYKAPFSFHSPFREGNYSKRKGEQCYVLDKFNLLLGSVGTMGSWREKETKAFNLITMLSGRRVLGWHNGTN